MCLNARTTRVLCLISLLMGCASPASYLPSSEEHNVIASWATFEEAKKAFDKIIPNQTKLDELEKYGFDPYKSKNIGILSYLGVINRFIPHPSIRFEQLDERVQDCISAKEACYAYEVSVQVHKRQRSGNVILDLVKFRRTVTQEGWNFDALILLKNDIVVYKIWSGKPYTSEFRDNKNPLGFIQESAGKSVIEGGGL